MGARNARNENTVRTLFRKFHGPSYPALGTRHLDLRLFTQDGAESRRKILQ